MIRNYSIIPLLVLGLSFCTGNHKEIKAPGVIDGEITSLKTLAGGTVAEMPLEEGQGVNAGALVLRINSDKLDNAIGGLDITARELVNTHERTREKITLTRANQAYLEKQVGRLERLSKSQAVAGDQLDKTRLQLLEARTTLFDLQKQLTALQIQQEKIVNQRQSLQLQKDDLVLKSPVDGQVLETFVKAGETVLPGTAVAEILDTASLYVDVFVEEKELTRLKLGDRPRLLIDGAAEQSFTGVIAYFGRKAEFSPKYILSEKERQALLYRVKVKIDRDVERFKIGMPVTVIF